MKTTQEIINQNQEQIERINHLLEPSQDPFIKFMESLIHLPPVPKPDLGRWLAVSQSVERL